MSVTLLPGSIVAMTDQAADRLVRLDNGDAALLYIYLLRHGDPNGLNWPPDRLDRALAALGTVGMAPRIAPRADAPEAIQPAPEYRTEDLTVFLEDKSTGFPMLCDEVERRLQKKLNVVDLKTLLTLYDHLSLPTEVILMLVGWCCEEQERKYGVGRKPPMSVIRKEGFIWARKGIDTLEKTDAHIQRLTRLQGREKEVLRLLDIPARPLVTREKEYIAAWDDMGFADDAIRMAYERTVLKKQSMDWSYMNGILRRWHEKGLHTAAAVSAADHDARPRAGTPGPVAPAIPEPPQNQQDYEAHLRRMRELMKQEG